MTLRKATLHPDSTRPFRNKEHLHLATVRVDGGDFMAVIKYCSAAALAAEVYCAVLLESLGFVTPAPLIVKIPGGYAYGTLFIDHPNLAEVHSGPKRRTADYTRWATAAARRLARWPKAAQLLLFDDLVDNRDRNMANLLVLPNEYAPIDHAETFYLSNLPPSNKLSILFSRYAPPYIAQSIHRAAGRCGMELPPNYGAAEREFIERYIPFVIDFLPGYHLWLQRRRKPFDRYLREYLR